MCCSVDLSCPCKGAGGGAFADWSDGVAVGAGAARWTTPDLLLIDRAGADALSNSEHDGDRLKADVSMARPAMSGLVWLA